MLGFMDFLKTLGTTGIVDYTNYEDMKYAVSFINIVLISGSFDFMWVKFVICILIGEILWLSTTDKKA